PRKAIHQCGSSLVTGFCADREEVSDGLLHAKDRSPEVARVHKSALDALYVIDPYPKKFTDEIYAINRDECRTHLDRSLAADGAAVVYCDPADLQIHRVSGALPRHRCAVRASCHSPLCRR
ncbi:MAG: hypothetical protein Q8N33_03040, partial [Rhodocyclaceae bacterium]|nr:hypothetical protein [Rhodocyclaceae bacterium]